MKNSSEGISTGVFLRRWVRAGFQEISVGTIHFKNIRGVGEGVYYFICIYRTREIPPR